MTWLTIWYVVYNLEIILWAYILYLHFLINMLQMPKAKFYRQTKIIVRTKKDIVRG